MILVQLLAKENEKGRKGEERYDGWSNKQNRGRTTAQLFLTLYRHLPFKKNHGHISMGNLRWRI